MTELGLRISSSSIRRKSVRGILKLKMVLEKLLQKSISLCTNKSSSYCEDYKEGCDCDTTNVAEDVKEGHFAVIAEDGDQEPKRFVVPLICLRNQAFLRLLEQAAEEYGFHQVGALTIPCRPSELQMLLAQQWHSEITGL